MPAIFEFVWKNRDVGTLSEDVKNLAEYKSLI